MVVGGSWEGISGDGEGSMKAKAAGGAVWQCMAVFGYQIYSYVWMRVSM
jgi:hypothetical protein